MSLVPPGKKPRLSISKPGANRESWSRNTLPRAARLDGGGRLKFDQWEDKQSGQKRSKLKVVLENVQFLSTRGGGGGGAGGSQQPAGEEGAVSPGPPASSKAAPSAKENVDEDVPF